MEKPKIENQNEDKSNKGSKISPQNNRILTKKSKQREVITTNKQYTEKYKHNKQNKEGDNKPINSKNRQDNSNKQKNLQPSIKNLQPSRKTKKREILASTET